MFKRSLSAFLAVMLMFSLVMPMTAFAEANDPTEATKVVDETVPETTQVANPDLGSSADTSALDSKLIAGDSIGIEPMATNYKLTVYSNGGTFGTYKTSAVKSAAEGTELAIKSVVSGSSSKPQRKHTDETKRWEHVGWNTMADGSGTAYGLEDKVVMTDNISLYAQWEEQDSWGMIFRVGTYGERIDYTYRADGVGATTQLSTKTGFEAYVDQVDGGFKAGVYYDITAVPGKGSDFVGWYIGDSCFSTNPVLTTAALRTMPKIKADTVIEARFLDPSTPRTVTYTDGVDNEEIFPDQVYANIPVGDPTPAFQGTPTRGGCEFAGWSPEVAETVTSNVTYVAQWTGMPELPTQFGENVTSDFVKIICDSDPEHPEKMLTWQSQSTKVYPADSLHWNEELGTWTVGVRVDSIKTYYIYFGYEKDNGTHEMVDDTNYIDITMKWDAAAQKWVHMDGKPLELHVKCQMMHKDPTALPSICQIKMSVTGASPAVLYYVNPQKGTYSFGEVKGNKKDGFTCDVTFAPVDEDANLVYFRNQKKLSSDYHYDWEATPEAQVYTMRADSITSAWYWVNAAGTKVNKINPEMFVTNVSEYTVTYTDGVEDEEVFADQATTVAYGAETPAFDGEPTRDGYRFMGWTPDVAETVKKNTTYTAKWMQIPVAPGSGTTNVTKELFTIRCVTREDHEDIVYNWFGSHVTYNKDMTWDEEKGAYTCTATVSGIKTILAFGTSCPNKVWKHTHYVDDAKPVIKLYYDPDATGLNSQGNEVTGLWLPDGQQIVTCYCYEKPAAPSQTTIEKLAYSSNKGIWLRDTNNTKNWYKDSKTFLPGTYTVGEMTGNETDGFFCTVKVTDFAPYIEKFCAKLKDYSYVIDTEKTVADFTFTLKYTGSATDYKQDGTGWVVDASSWADNTEKLNGKTLWMIREFTVTYTDGVEDKEIFADQTNKVQEGKETPAFVGETTRTGYTFAGWTPEVAATVSGDTVYTATWTANTYNVSFDSNGGTPNYDFVVKQVTFDGVYGDLPMVVRTGYEFAGWADAEGNVVTAETIYTIPADSTLTAQWKANTYTVTLDPDGGELETTTVTVTYGSAVGTLPVPTKTGYTFAGWVDANGDAVTAETVYATLGDSTYTATWTVNTYTVTFMPNGCDGTFEPITVTFGEKYGDLPVAGKTAGIRNDGWFLADENGNPTGRAITKNTKVAVAADHVLVQKRAVIPPTFKIVRTFLGDMGDDYGYYDPVESRRQLTATITTLDTVNEELITYTYQWYKDDVLIEGATDKVLTVDGNVSDSGTYKCILTATLKDGVDIYMENRSATREATHVLKIMPLANTLIYNYNGGVNSKGEDHASYYSGGKTITVRPQVMSKTGYTFAGWNTEADGSGTAYANYDVITFVNDNGNGGDKLTIYAQWTTKQYTLTVDMGDGKEPVTVPVTYEDVVGDKLTEPSKDGYTFAGWVDADGNPVDVNVPYTEDFPSELVATFQANSYEISFDSNGGTPGYADVVKKVTFDAPYGDLPPVGKKGYVFAGWMDENGDIVTKESIYNIAHNSTLTAQWEIGTYTVTLDTDGGTEVDPITVTYNQPIGELPEVTKTGYTFAGWVDEKGNPVDEDTLFTMGEDTTFTAQWTANTYKVSFDSKGGSEVDPITVTFDKAVGKLPTPTLKGKTFLGWYYPGGAKVTADTIYTIASDITLVAKWVDEGTTSSPKTGDNSAMGLWMVMMIVSAAGLCMVIGRKKRYEA